MQDNKHARYYEPNAPITSEAELGAGW
jgi:hypothetical protein